MNTTSIEDAAQYLVAARKRGTPGPRIPDASRPATVDDALAIQARVTELLGQPIGGYKCSVGNEQRPVWMAPIYAPTITTSTRFAVKGTGKSASVEPEVAWVIGRDLAAPGSDDDIKAAIKEARLVVEILGSRYADFGKPGIVPTDNLADGVANQGLMIGPVLDNPWQRRLESFPVSFRTPTEVISEREGKHPDGHPLLPLYWLARFLAKRGTPLRAGMIVTCGSYLGIVEVPLDTPITVRWGDMGSLTATFTGQ